jgi:hypothetical protein
MSLSPFLRPWDGEREMIRYVETLTGPEMTTITIRATPLLADKIWTVRPDELARDATSSFYSVVSPNNNNTVPNTEPKKKSVSSRRASTRVPQPTKLPPGPDVLPLTGWKRDWTVVWHLLDEVEKILPWKAEVHPIVSSEAVFACIEPRLCALAENGNAAARVLLLKLRFQIAGNQLCDIINQKLTYLRASFASGQSRRKKCRRYYCVFEKCCQGDGPVPSAPITDLVESTSVLYST